MLCSARKSSGMRRLSRYAYLVSLLPERIARDLDLRVELRTRRTSACAPPDLLAPGRVPEPEAWDAFYALTDAAARRLFPTVLEPLPTRARAQELLGEEAWRALVEQPLGATLAERFSDPLVRGVVGTDGLIGTFASLHDEGLRQNRCFLWHVLGGPWRVPVGGMGAVTDALARAAAAGGTDLRRGAEVVAIDGGDVTWRAGGREETVRAGHVLSGVAPAVLARLRGRPAPGGVPEGCQTKVNLLLDRLPGVVGGIDPQDAFAGTFRLHEREDELEAAYAAAVRGRLPDPAPAELYCHSLTDPSIVPSGMHTLTLFGLHTPASLFDAHADAKEVLLARYLDALDEHLDEPIRDCVARDADGAPCIEAKSPLDVERELGMPGGNIFHGDLDWPWSEDGGGWGVETAHPRTFVCGSGARRGGGVSCVGGHNAAMAVLERGQ